MSLGWQTESALLPSKAKPIRVNDKSILSLKAVVFEKEQQLKSSHARPGISKSVLGKRAAPVEQERKPSKSSSSDVDDREQRAQDALLAKAKMYDDIMEGRAQGASSLVDFRSKAKKEAPRCPERTAAPPPPPPPPPPPIESKRKAEVQAAYGPQQWQWSRGNEATQDTAAEDAGHNPEAVVEEWRTAQREERAFQHEMDERIAQQERASMSDGARIKTQWEKTLHSSARGYLDQVRKEISANTGGAGSGESRTSREERLQLLQRRRQQQQQQQQQHAES